MSLFRWNDTYLLGIQEFDAHHQHLMDLLNASFAAFEANMHAAQLGPLLDALVDYAGYHFSAEECWMQAHNYPRTEAHAAQHRAFSAKLAELRLEQLDGQATLNADLFAFLADWLVLHILESDADYKRHLQDISAASGHNLP